jgi:uncharacterized damage-inducible protein DinB
MSRNSDFLSEFRQEVISTRKYLELVPMEKRDYKPHDKNYTLGKLAAHVAEVPSWVPYSLDIDDLNFSATDFKPYEPETKEDLLKFYDENVKKAEETLLKNYTDEDYDKIWTMRDKDKIYIQIPKYLAMRVWCLNHWYHHRAQLGIYLRLLDIPLPGIYGPTADEPQM